METWKLGAVREPDDPPAKRQFRHQKRLRGAVQRGRSPRDFEGRGVGGEFPRGSEGIEATLEFFLVEFAFDAGFEGLGVKGGGLKAVERLQRGGLGIEDEEPDRVHFLAHLDYGLLGEQGADFGLGGLFGNLTQDQRLALDGDDEADAAFVRGELQLVAGLYGALDLFQGGGELHDGRRGKNRVEMNITIIIHLV